MKYYFICYEWTRDGMAHWEKSNKVSNVHPVIWLKDMIDNYQDKYRITFFQEIEKEHFDLIDGWID